MQKLQATFLKIDYRRHSRSTRALDAFGLQPYSAVDRMNEATSSLTRAVVYGDGQQIRDWLYVKDHCNAIRRVLEGARLCETYNVGGWNEKPNIEIVHTVCALLDELRPKADGSSYQTQITFVKDRPGHDRRYAIDARKLESELGWKPAETFESGIRKTVEWYLDNPEWVANVQSGAYREWVQQQYSEVK